MSPVPVYQIRDLRRDLGGRRILSLSDLEVDERQVLGFVGPNGAGKSTLLRILAMLEPWDAGEIRYRSARLAYPAPLDLRRQVTMVFQRPVLLNHTVRENIAYGLRLRGENPEPVVEELIERVGLRAVASQNARRLSGGEAQRVALARALALRPRVLLLDEPTAHLDPASVEQIEAIIQNIKSTADCTIVLVTHNIHQARRLADRVGFLLGGELVEVQPSEAFFSSPEDPRSAAFVSGEMTY
ncbi:MAG: phosphate ABC transporter ATP-binding protein [Anaerolineales bacterium]|nr:phosphate ABC transporter ATP-binding protein [Anaerolineales bacterium]